MKYGITVQHPPRCGSRWRNVGHGHVVRKLQFVVPNLFAVENCRAKPIGPVFPAVRVYLRGPFNKLLSVLVEMAIMVQVVNGYFMTALSNSIEKS